MKVDYKVWNLENANANPPAHAMIQLHCQYQNRLKIYHGYGLVRYLIYFLTSSRGFISMSVTCMCKEEYMLLVKETISNCAKQRKTKLCRSSSASYFNVALSLSRAWAAEFSKEYVYETWHLHSRIIRAGVVVGPFPLIKLHEHNQCMHGWILTHGLMWVPTADARLCLPGGDVNLLWFASMGHQWGT